MDIPYICYLDAIGQSPTPQKDFEEGIIWINETFDLYSIIDYMKRGVGFKELIKAYRGKRTYALWSLYDPMPFFSFIIHIIKKAFHKFFRKFSFFQQKFP